MDPKVEALVVILTAVSVIIIVFDIIFDPTGAYSHSFMRLILVL